MLKNDTLKNDMSHIGLYGSAPPDQKPKNIYPKIAILKKAKIIPLNIRKVQSESSKISNLGQIFIFTENCTANYPYELF